MAIRESNRISPIKDLSSKLISVSEASRASGLTTSFIRRLLRRGDLEGLKIGNGWVTTEKAILEYLKTERRPGPKPRKEPPPRRKPPV